MASPVLAIVPATQLTNSAAGLYTSPAGVWTQIVSLTCQNTDVTSHQVTFYLVPAAGSAGSTNVITNAQALSPKQSWSDPFVPNSWPLEPSPSGRMKVLSAVTAAGALMPMKFVPVPEAS